MPQEHTGAAGRGGDGDAAVHQRSGGAEQDRGGGKCCLGINGGFFGDRLLRHDNNHDDGSIDKDDDDDRIGTGDCSSGFFRHGGQAKGEAAAALFSGDSVGA